MGLPRFVVYLAVIAAVLAALFCLTRKAHADTGRTGELRLMAVTPTNGGGTVAPVLGVKVGQPMNLPVLGGVDMHMSLRHALDRGSWCENQFVLGGTKKLLGRFDVTADYERKYNTDISRVWLSVGMPFRF